MKVAIYNPYLDTAGGGDKYMMVIAEILARESTVDVLLDEHLWLLGIDSIKKRLERLHGLDLSNVNFIKAPIGLGSSFFQRYLFLRRYDYLFYLSDGSFFFSTARHNIVHFQMPLDKVAVGGIWGQIKFRTWERAIYNSIFTKRFIEKMVKIRGEVVYPPVSVDLFKPVVKKEQILTVGRFASHTRDKKHEVLIKAFKEMVKKKNIFGWSLHLAGGMTESDKVYVEKLKEQAGGSDIVFHPDVSLEQLIRLYGESAIYWHAKGYGEDDPKKTEHFGISTVEAMAAGCVPVVINKGGQPEIIDGGVNGFLWDNLEQLEEMTIRLIRDPKMRDKMAGEAHERSRQFSKDRFAKTIKDMIRE